jgi:cell wall-associated NlpC family hydrolase
MGLSRMPDPDPRRHAFRPDLADVRLRGKVTAERYVEGVLRRLIVPSIELHAKPRTGQPATTEVLWGEDVLVFEELKDWAFVQLLRDGYVGYLARDALGPADETPTHRVACLWGYGFKSADIKSNLRMVLPMGARVAGMRDGDFLKLSGGLFMPRQHAETLAAHESDFVAAAERFLGTPYRWGGKTALGLDCSGLLQVSLQAAGIEAPRDSDMQEAEIGAPLPKEHWSRLQRGDLVFWAGHTGIMTDATRLLHANAHAMAVTCEPLIHVIARAEARGSPVRSIRRPAALDRHSSG